MDPKEYINTLRKEYIDLQIKEQERDVLIAEDNIEAEAIKGYHGREILELLQNADDAYQKSIDRGEKPEKDLEVSIRYEDNILTVSNTGTLFDEDGIKAIVQGNNSPKKGGYIGNKGTGFRSILNWADTVRIYSGEFNVEFSKAIAGEVFQSIIGEKQIQKQLARKKDLYVPMLAVPVNISPKPGNDRTLIEIVIDPGKTDELSAVKQIDSIDLKTLLFLPNICVIDIFTEGNHVVYSREDAGKKRYRIKKSVNGEDVISEEYLVFRDRLPQRVVEDLSTGEKKDILLAVAIPEDPDNCEVKHLYSFFPLHDTESPFPCVMHASYILGAHRDTIPNNEVNRIIIEEQLSFLVKKVVPELIRMGEIETAQKILIPKGFLYGKIEFLQPFGKFDSIVDFYRALVSKCPVFETVNRRKVSVEDHPKMIEGEFPKCFAGSNFEQLLKRIDDRRVGYFLQTLAGGCGITTDMSEEELLRCINKMSKGWTASHRAEVFDWWNERYNSSLPKLLKDGNGNWVRHGGEYYFFVGDTSEIQIPRWVKTPTVDSEDQRELFRIAKKKEKIKERKAIGDKRDISRLICDAGIYSTVEFKYRDRNNIVSAVNASVKTYRQAVEYVKWLWNHYAADEKWSPEDKIGYKFPSVQKNVAVAEKLYIGKENGRPLANKLFGEGYSEFPSREEFGIGEGEQERFLEFIESFGVHLFPEIRIMRVEPSEAYRKILENKILKNGDVGASGKFAYTKFNIPYIENMEQILQGLTMGEIISWVQSDYQLQTVLRNRYYDSYDSDATVVYLGIWQENPRRFTRGIDNYILMQFNSIPWLSIRGKKTSPSDTVKGYSQWNQNKKFADLLDVLTTEDIEKAVTETGIPKDEISEVLEVFDLKGRVTDLRSPLFYKLMLEIPDLDIAKAEALSRAVYWILGQAEFNTIYEDCPEKERFFREGKVLVRNNNRLSFAPASSAYLPSTTIINRKAYNIVEKGLKTKNESFETVLGCRRYERDYKVLKETIELSAADREFREYFEEFKKYARPYAELYESLKKEFDRLNIKLVSRISILQNDEELDVEEEYTLLQDKGGSWYLTEHRGVFDCRKVSEFIEIIFEGYANSKVFDADKIGELFRTEKKEDREFLIRKNFGSLSCLDESIFHNEVRENFIRTVEKLTGSKPDVSSINFDYFEQTGNIAQAVRILRERKLDIGQLQEAGFEYSLDLLTYYRKLCDEFILKERQNYKNWLFTKALKENTLQKSFLARYDAFENYELPEIENSVYFDFREKIITVFGDWTEDTEELKFADESYSKNYEVMNPEKKFEDEIANDREAQRMIFFWKEEEFKKWLEDRSSGENAPVDQEKEYEALRRVIPEEKSIEFSETAAEAERSGGAGRRLSSTAVTGTAMGKTGNAKKLYGNKGELLIYNMLCEKYAKVNPRSEAFVALGIRKPGQGKSGEYDLSYVNENGDEIFVEVKAGDSNQFYISPKELEFARNHADRYELYLVSDINSGHPKYEKVPEKFWEDPKFRQHEIIESILIEF